MELLRFIASFIETHGYAPALRDIGAALGIKSTNGIVDHLRSMERKGVIRVARGVARSIVVTERGREELAVPFD